VHRNEFAFCRIRRLSTQLVVHVAETWPGTSTQILVYLEMLNNFFCQCFGSGSAFDWRIKFRGGREKLAEAIGKTKPRT
jgi:hypothetical protein